METDRRARVHTWVPVVGMRRWRWASVMAVMVAPMLSAASADLAPDSIAGKVLREFRGIASLRTVSRGTFEIGAGGRYTVLMGAGGSTLTDVIGATLLLRNPGGGGIYAYTKTGSTTARLDLTPDGRVTRTLELRFSSATDGDFADNSPGSVHTWTLLDGTTLETAPVINVSTRGVVLPGHPMIVGFVVSGTNARDVLIRAVGPSLVSFNVSDVWADPDFTVHRVNYFSVNPLYYLYRDWSRIERHPGQSEPSADSAAAFQQVFDRVGAFSLLADSKDAAMIAHLEPGAYTVVAEAGPADPGGEALVEVYCLP